ncbi:MAG TPA: hypothetical protein VD994_01510 [Prosthecobacter sp.]|nr:hypothetical protein [Prosthecobacter sp.]
MLDILGIILIGLGAPLLFTAGLLIAGSQPRWPSAEAQANWSPIAGIFILTDICRGLCSRSRAARLGRWLGVIGTALITLGAWLW